MKKKEDRLDTIRMIISNKEIGSQDELLKELSREGYVLTQATLSRDLKQMKVAKAADATGKYIYVLPNNIMYKRVFNQNTGTTPVGNGFVSVQFSGNLAVIKTRPGYASRIAFDIDNRDFTEILGTVAGDDTIILVLRQGTQQEEMRHLLSFVIPEAHP